MAFYGREKELNMLRNAINQRESHCFLVTGQHGIGKTAFIAHLLKGAKADVLFFQCLKASAEQNAFALAQAISEMPTSKGTSLIRKGHQPSLHDLFYLLFQMYSNDLIIVLDEYSNLRKSLPDADDLIRSAIQDCIDRNKFIILCDSDADLLNHLCSRNGPFWKLSASPIQLAAMDYVEAASFYPEHSHEDKVRLYAAFGGLPAFAHLIDPKASVRENITRCFIGPDALAGHCIRELLEKAANSENVNSVLYAMAYGADSFADILTQSHLSSAPTLSDTLNKLLEMDMIRRETPVNDPDNRRRAKYRIANHAVSFWFRYIFPRQSLLYTMTPDAFYDLCIADDFEQHFLPAVFTDICAQYLHRLYHTDASESVRQIGRYSLYDRHAKIMHDVPLVVVDSEETETCLPVCTNEPLTNDEIYAEVNRIRDKARLYCNRYCFISFKGFIDMSPVRQVQKLTIADLYQNM